MIKPTKPFAIDKQVVWQSYLKVKANRGSAGVDGQSLKAYEVDLKGNLYKLWNRMSSGSYFPPPVKRVEIAKASGGKRALGIPTVTDRIAQMVVKQYLEPELEPIFHADSYGYRVGKSALEAVKQTRKRCWQYDWVVEFDIKGAFDHIDHAMLLKALRHHGVPPWIELYITRWLTAPFEHSDGTCEARTLGVPQGGVISPLLMNLFMHYTFDLWMGRSFAHSPFARYADDAVVHCRSRQEAQEVYQAIEERLAVCKLQMHPEKSSIVYCRDSNRQGNYAKTQFTFLGFTFRSRASRGKRGVFSNFLPGVSNEALNRMRAEIRSWRLGRKSPMSLEDLSHRYNPIIRGWWEYYGTFYRSELRKLAKYLDERLAHWAKRKYKRLGGRRGRSGKWLYKLSKANSHLFVHWREVGGMMGAG